MPESLKNILLVMADGGYLVQPSQDPSKEKIWVETQKRLDRFLPHLFGEIFPVVEPSPPPPPPQQHEQSSEQARHSETDTSAVAAEGETKPPEPQQQSPADDDRKEGVDDDKGDEPATVPASGTNEEPEQPAEDEVD